MKALSNQVTVSKSNHGRYKWRVRYPEGGKRKNKYFNIKADANKFAVQTRKDIANEGVKSAPVTDTERRALEVFREYADTVPASARPTLETAINDFIARDQLRDKSKTCEELTDELLHRIAKKAEEKPGKGKRNLDDVRLRLGKFNALYGDWLACDICSDIVEEFLDDLNLSAQSVRHYYGKLNQLFRYAVKKEFCDENPVSQYDPPEVGDTDVGVLTPKQAAAYLCACDDTITPGVAIGLFAGLRESEIQRLDWSCVHLGEGHIDLSGKDTKKNRRRVIDMSDNLKAWLKPYAQPKGSVIGGIAWRWRNGKKLAREAVGLTKWPHNAVRHSYSSYHLAEHSDSGKTAKFLGHTNARVLYDYYNKVVTPKDAHTYWSIVPEKASNITDIKAS
jgi:integrase